MKVYEIFKKIEATASKNDKVQIIKDNADNKEFVEYLKFLYDDMITTGLSTKKINKEIKTIGMVDESYFGSPIGVMEYLKENNTGTDKDIAFVQRYLGSFVMLDDTVGMGDYIDWLKQVFTKSYKCGITASSVNKAIPDCIKEFKVQLANSYKDVADRMKGVPYTATIKLDGHRTLVHISSDLNRVIFRTRKGHEVTGLDEIANDILKVFPMDIYGVNGGTILDGEITVINFKDKKDIFQETSKIVRKDGKKTGLKFSVFDTLSYKHFMNGGTEGVFTYSFRRSGLEELFSHQPKHKYFELVESLYVGNDEAIIPKLLQKAIEDGEEGIMINVNDSQYYTKRHNGLLKCKEFKNGDLLCTGVFEGASKYSGMLGGITVDYIGNAVDCGSGFTDEQRVYYWNNPDEIIGKIVQLKYFEETTNQKDSGKSLRFPIFQTIREDKSEEDINIE